MPGAVPNTSTYALTNVTLPYVRAIADSGWRAALRADAALARGLNVHGGRRRQPAGRRGARPRERGPRRRARLAATAGLHRRAGPGRIARTVTPSRTSQHSPGRVPSGGGSSRERVRARWSASGGRVQHDRPLAPGAAEQRPLGVPGVRIPEHDDRGAAGGDPQLGRRVGASAVADVDQPDPRGRAVRREARAVARRRSPSWSPARTRRRAVPEHARVVGRSSRARLRWRPGPPIPARCPIPAARPGSKRAPSPPASTCSSRLAEPQEQARAERAGEGVHRRHALRRRGEIDPHRRALAGEPGDEVDRLGAVVGAEAAEQHVEVVGEHQELASSRGGPAISSRDREPGVGRGGGQAHVLGLRLARRGSRAPWSCPNRSPRARGALRAVRGRARRAAAAARRAGRRGRRRSPSRSRGTADERDPFRERVAPGARAVRLRPGRARIAATSSRPARASCTSRTPAPSATRARPGGSTGSAAAASVPITATLSARSVTRSEMRRVMFASTASRTTPDGRCVHSTRWSPSERPRAARSANTGCSSGCSATTAANSSTTMTSRARPPAGSSSIDRAARSASSRSRRRSSARRLSTARAARRPSRSLRVPITCGRPASGANAAPPLKSTSRNDTRDGGFRAARATTQATSSSLLPEPVVPAISACGPWATRSSQTGPRASRPIGAARPVADPPG